LYYFPNFTSWSPFPELVWPQSPGSHLSEPVAPDLFAGSDAHSDPASDPEQGLAAGCKGAVKYGVQPQLICVEHWPAEFQAAAQAAAASVDKVEQDITNKAEAKKVILSGRLF